MNNETDLSFLTERQRTAYILKEQGLSNKQIGESMNTSVSAVAHLLQAAKSKIEKYEIHCRLKEKSAQPIDFPLTRGELDMMISALLVFEKNIVKKRGGHYCSLDVKNYLPYDIERLSELCERAQISLYGKILHEGYKKD